MKVEFPVPFLFSSLYLYPHTYFRGYQLIRNKLGWNKTTRNNMPLMVKVLGNSSNAGTYATKVCFI